MEGTGLGLGENYIGELIGDPQFAASPDPDKSLPARDNDEPSSKSSSERHSFGPSESRSWVQDGLGAKIWQVLASVLGLAKDLAGQSRTPSTLE